MFYMLICKGRSCLYTEWGAGGTPLKNLKNIGFPSNIGPDPLKITKLPSQQSLLGHFMAFGWLADDGLLFSGIWILSTLIKKNVV